MSNTGKQCGCGHWNNITMVTVDFLEPGAKVPGFTCSSCQKTWFDQEQADLIDLIRRQKREIETLTAANEALKGEVDKWEKSSRTWHAEVCLQIDRKREVEALNAKIREELEHERVRLAGCGVAAMQNTPSSVSDRAKPEDYGYSASYSDVCKAVDREMKYRESLERILGMPQADYELSKIIITALGEGV